jgi:hypothetical protein
MDKTLAWEPTAEDIAAIDAAIKQCVAEMEQAQEQMRCDQADIEYLKAETRAMLATLKAE